jgi:hypothetical protein
LPARPIVEPVAKGRRNRKKRKGGRMMAGKIEWEDSLEKGIVHAKAANKQILLDFFNPQ